MFYDTVNPRKHTFGLRGFFFSHLSTYGQKIFPYNADFQALPHPAVFQISAIVSITICFTQNDFSTFRPAYCQGGIS